MGTPLMVELCRSQLCFLCPHRYLSFRKDGPRRESVTSPNQHFFEGQPEILCIGFSSPGFRGPIFRGHPPLFFLSSPLQGPPFFPPPLPKDIMAGWFPLPGERKTPPFFLFPSNLLRSFLRLYFPSLFFFRIFSDNVSVPPSDGSNSSPRSTTFSLLQCFSRFGASPLEQIFLNKNQHFFFRG